MVTTRNHRAKPKSHPKVAKKAAVKADSKKTTPAKKQVPVKKASAKPVQKKDSKKIAATKPVAKKVTKKVLPKRQAAAPTPPKQKKPAGSSFKGYTTDQYKKIKDLIESLNQDYTATQLKEECRSNDQKVTGTKDELIGRVAEGRVLGAIPRCPSCGGGRPRFDPKTGTYSCPGYMEDVDFVNCFKRYAIDQLARVPWQ